MAHHPGDHQFIMFLLYLIIFIQNFNLQRTRLFFKVHKIDSESPFYSMSARDFLKKRYEIVVLLEGVIEQTGNSIQVSSEPLVTLLKQTNKQIV